MSGYTYCKHSISFLEKHEMTQNVICDLHEGHMLYLSQQSIELENTCQSHQHARSRHWITNTFLLGDSIKNIFRSRNVNTVTLFLRNYSSSSLMRKGGNQKGILHFRLWVSSRTPLSTLCIVHLYALRMELSSRWTLPALLLQKKCNFCGSIKAGSVWERRFWSSNVLSELDKVLYDHELEYFEVERMGAILFIILFNKSSLWGIQKICTTQRHRNRLWV